MEGVRTKIVAIPRSRGCTLKLKTNQGFAKNEDHLELRQPNNTLFKGVLKIFQGILQKHPIGSRSSSKKIQKILER